MLFFLTSRLRFFSTARYIEFALASFLFTFSFAFYFKQKIQLSFVCETNEKSIEKAFTEQLFLNIYTTALSTAFFSLHIYEFSAVIMFARMLLSEEETRAVSETWPVELLIKKAWLLWKRFFPVTYTWRMCAFPNVTIEQYLIIWKVKSKFRKTVHRN